MATKEIGLKLKITSDGTEKVINNLSDLEQELSRLQNEIKTLDFGSEAFVQAAKNIQTLKTKIDDVDKSTEGLGAEKRFRALGDAVNVLVGSFQVLTGIIGLVISDSEDLEEVQKAETFALGALNVALGINAVNTALVESATTRQKIATQLNTLATKAATIAQAAWNAVLAANPVLIVVGAITALTAAIALYTKATDASADAEERANAIADEAVKINNELIGVRIEATSQLQQQFRILTDNVRARNLELSVVEELKKTYPGFNAFLDANNNLTDKGNEFLAIQIKLLGAKATLDALYKKKADLNVQSTEALNKVIDNQNSFIGRLTNAFKFGLNPAAQFYGAAAEFTPTIEATNQLIAKEEKAVNDLLGQIKPLNDELKRTADAEAKLGKTTTETTKTFDKATAKILQRIGVLDILIGKLGEAQNAELTFLDGVSEKQQEIIGEQNDFLTAQTEALATRSEIVSKEINDLFFKAIPSYEQLSKASGAVFTLFKEIQKRISSPEFDIKKGLNIQGVIDELTGGDSVLKDLFATIPEATIVSFNEFVNSYETRIAGLKTKFQEIGGEQIDLLSKEPKELYKIILEVEKEQSKLFKDRIKNGQTENEILEQGRKLIFERLLADQGFAKAQEELKKANQEYNAAVKSGNVDNIEKTAAALKLQTDVVAKYKELADTILDGVVRNNKFVESIQAGGEAFEKGAKQVDDNAAKIQQALDPARVKEYFKQNAEDYVSFLRLVADNNAKYLERFGLDGVKAIFSGVEEGLKDIEGKSREELQTIQTNLQVLGDELQKDFNLEENPFIKLLGEISKRLKQLPTEAEDNFQKTLEKVSDIVGKFTQVFNDLSSRTQQLFASQTSLYLEQLAYAEEQALATIGNATEREREETAKVQKEYAKKRFDIEKQARIQELQFTLANTIANAAGAIVNALALPAPPPIPQLYAASIGGLTALQVATINDQIQFAKSKQFVGRRGGLIMGESHEGSNGGVPAMLEGGEFVVNKEGVRQFGDIISSINTATGGRSLSIDDSRIVQAIASQNSNTKMPLKAYVLYNDIQSTTKLNQKITNLARL